MRKIKEVLRLKLDARLSHEQIAAALDLSKGVVTKYVGLAAAAGLDWAAVQSLDDVTLERRLLASPEKPRHHVQPDFGRIHHELRRKGVTLMLLWEEYRAEYAERQTYGYSQFCENYRHFAKRLKRSMRQIHRGGEKLFIDFAGPTLALADGGRAHIYVAAMGASSYTFACATERETMADWLDSTGRALAFYGGVPAKSPAGDFAGNQQVLVMRRSAAEPAPSLASRRRLLHITRGLKVNLATQASQRRVSIAAVSVSSSSVRDARVPRAS